VTAAARPSASIRVRFGEERLRRWRAANPSPGRELLAVSVAAWVAIAPHVITSGQPGHAAGSALAIGAGIAATTIAFTVMAVGMVLPPARPAAAYVARASLPARRARSVTWFAAGAVAAWVAFAIPASVWHETVSGVPAPAVASAFVAVAAWTRSRARRDRMLRCLRTQPIRAHGRAADRSSWCYGLAVGRRCLVVCAPAMAATVICGHHPLVVAWMAVTALAERSVGTGERLATAIAVGWLSLAAIWLVAHVDAVVVLSVASI
jgi:predicted metal-binding membrane protein